MARISPRKPHPHSVDLLRNSDSSIPLGPFDGTVAAHAQIGAQHYFITTNTNYVPAVPSLEIPHKVYLRTDMRYGTDDPTLWPQQYTAFYCHLPLISKKGARRELDIMWWTPSESDFEIGSAVTRGLGRLKQSQFSKFLPLVNELVPQCKALRQKSPALAIPLFGQLIQQLVMWIEQLQSLPTTYPKMLFAITSLQRTFLELDALYIYMTVYKERMDNYMADTNAEVGQFVGAFTTVPTVVQQFWGAGVPIWFVRPYEVFDKENILAVVHLQEPRLGLYDPDEHAQGAPPALYTGNSTQDKIAAIHHAARKTPWYTDPFETGFTRPRSPPPTAASASTSRPVPPPSVPVSSSFRAVGQQNQRQKPRYNPYPVKAPAKAPATAPCPTAKTDRDKFAALAVVEMPPSIPSMADALAKVDRSVIPYTSNGADRRYVLPEPALLVNTTPDRRRKFLHHWSLLRDGFLYLLTQHHPRLLSAPEWRDVLEGLLTERGRAGSRTQRRSLKLEDLIRPALEASNVASIEGLPVPLDHLPHFTVEKTREIVWLVAETSFRFEFCALDRRASGKDRLDEVRTCFAGHMLVGPPLHLSKQGWAAPALEERHRYVGRAAFLMLDWTTKSARPDIINHVKNLHFHWSLSDMQLLETAVCRHYTQAFWEYFGRAAVLPMRLEHELDKEEGEI
ncbi:hypothetical protein GGX14DRAFT_399886 [Mycena pura]|uniref:Uncharacterized protein n=1 Tax=Mycena pura TaxID=153505 RepID=A0AAD6YBY9_9AGAR|nr:hypothetical protein GGX14DRAFT_399886 [Mycena pura]